MLNQISDYELMDMYWTQLRDDNRIENLRLMTAHDHISMHMKERYKEKMASKC